MLFGKVFSNEDTLWEAIKNERENISVEQYKKLTSSMIKNPILNSPHIKRTKHVYILDVLLCIFLTYVNSSSINL